MPRKRIKYWSFYYMPRWEAASKEVQQLLQHFDGPYETHLNAFSAKSPRFYRSENVRCLPIPWSLPAIPFLIASAKRYDINHIFGSQSECIVTPRMAGPRTVLTIAKDSGSEDALRDAVPMMRKLGRVVVESTYHYDLLTDAGLDTSKVQIIYPGITKRDYVPSPKPFTILFATSPRGKHRLQERGIDLIIEVARRMTDVHWLLAWRDDNYDQLVEMMGGSVLPNVEVKNGYIPDMGALYDHVDATVLPALNPYSLKPTPHSALESLAHGKPLLVTKHVSLAPIVESESCGAVFEASVDGLIEAVQALRVDYDAYQKNCHPTVDKNFSADGFIDGYTKLYEELLSAG